MYGFCELNESAGNLLIDQHITIVIYIYTKYSIPMINYINDYLVHILQYILTHTHTHTHTYIHTHTHTYIYIYIYIYI